MTARELVLFAIGAVAACTGIDTGQRARDRAVEVLGCDQVEMTQLEEHRFHASGCGQEVDLGCTSGALEPTCIRIATAGGEHPTERAEEAEEEVRVDAGVVAAQGTTSTSAEQTIRAGLDARHADIFACTQRDPTVVRVTYGADGSLEIRLGAGLEGSPEEGCVRAALWGARATGGGSGTVIHLVHGR